MEEVDIDGEKLKVVSSIDAVGLFCPLPVVKLKLELEKIELNKIVELSADDPGILDDLRAWCNETGNRLLSLTKNKDGIFVAYVQKRKEQDAMETIESIIREHIFFKDLKEEYLALIFGCAKNIIFKKDERILKEGEPADHFYLVRSGLVAIEISLGNRGPLTIQTISGGDILGWSWLIPPYNNRFDCRAVEPARTIAFDGKCLRAKCEENHDLGYDFLKRLTKVFVQRLEATRLQLINMYER